MHLDCGMFHVSYHLIVNLLCLLVQNEILKYVQFNNIFMKHKLNQVNNHLVVSNGTPCEFYGNNVDCSGQ